MRSRHHERRTNHAHPNDEGIFILGNRHIVELKNGTLILKQRPAKGFLHSFKDFIVHELTHARQAQLLREHPDWKVTRGAHRDLGWYTAVAEACPRYLGFELPSSIWPTGPRTRKGTITEVEMTHWPMSLRLLALDKDERLPLAGAAQELMCNEPVLPFA